MDGDEPDPEADRLEAALARIVAAQAGAGDGSRVRSPLPDALRTELSHRLDAVIAELRGVLSH